MIYATNQFAGAFFGVSCDEMREKPLEDYMTNSFFSLSERFHNEILRHRVDYDVTVTCHGTHIVCGIQYNVVYDQSGECQYAIIIVNNMSKQYAMLHKL